MKKNFRTLSKYKIIYITAYIITIIKLLNLFYMVLIYYIVV